MVMNSINSTVRLVFFAHNRDDAAVKKRARSLLGIGVDVTGIMFRRDNAELEPGPEWKNIDIGLIPHCQHFKRIGVLLGSLGTIFSNRHHLVGADIFYARNLDMLILSFISVLFIPRAKRPKLVYECLDVHEVMTANGISAHLLRWLERRALSIIDHLVVSSPAFMSEYFIPVQGYSGPYSLMENKLYFDDKVIPRPVCGSVNISEIEPLVIAWVGILRCQKTLDLLMFLAKSEPDNVIIRFRGLVSHFLIPDFDQQIAEYANIVYEGAYTWPDGLVDAYSGAHFVWAQELSWSGYNSDWLLPNRIYEGSYFGALAISIEGTETAKVVRERNLGYVLPDSAGRTLVHFIRHVNKSDVKKKQEKLLGSDKSHFIATKEEVSIFIKNILG